MKKEVSRWFFDFVLKPLAVISVLFGIEITVTKKDGTSKTFNARGKKWKWLRKD